MGERGDQTWVFSLNYQYWRTLSASIEVCLQGAPETTDLDCVVHHFPDGPRVPVSLEWTFDLSAPGALEAIADGGGRIVLTDLASMFYNDTV